MRLSFLLKLKNCRKGHWWSSKLTSIPVDQGMEGMKMMMRWKVFSLPDQHQRMGWAGKPHLQKSRVKVAERWFIYMVSPSSSMVRSGLMIDINNLDGEMDDLKSICSNAVSVKAYHLRSTGQESKYVERPG